VLVAAADAVRQKAAEPEVVPTTSAPPGTTTQGSPATGLSGVLYYTDEECRLQGVQFPDIEPVGGPEWAECKFSLSPDARRDFEWSPDEDWIALATPNNVYVDLTERREFPRPPRLRRVGIVAADLAWRGVFIST